MEPTHGSPALVSRARCPLCGSFLVALIDPGARETLGCVEPSCIVTDDPTLWLPTDWLPSHE